jgi:hypothetical protein
MQKRVTVLIVLIGLIFLSVGFASAGSCDIKLKTTCDSEGDYTVMGVSTLTNAHGELASEGNYDYVLCCDFGTGNTTCKTTSPLNKIVGLSSVTNAHAEIPSNVEYTTSVCYEDLTCKQFDGACPIEPLDPTNWYGVEMLSLSADTNAHIGGFGDYLSNNICCRSNTYAAPPCSLTDAYWSWDEEGTDAIEPEDDPALAEKDVYLIVEGISCAGEEISFEVWEYDPFSANELMDSNPPGNVIFGEAVGTWETEYIDDAWGTNPEYYFIATVVESDPEEDMTSPIPRLIVKSTTIWQYCVDEGIYKCENYDEAEACKFDDCEVADDGSEVCDENSCECSWNDDDEVCEQSYSSGGECGDGIISAGETCDGINFGPITGCSDFDSFTAGEGTLSCDSSCQFDTSLCEGGTTGVCDDDIINTGETCDGTNWGLITGCSNFDEFTEGEETLLSCDSSCQFDTSLCEGGVEVGGTCTITQDVQSECDEDPEGLFIYSWIGDWDGVLGPAQIECEAGGEDETIECPAQVQLPLENWIGIIAIIIIIALVYFFWDRKKQRKISKNNSSKKRKKK